MTAVVVGVVVAMVERPRALVATAGLRGGGEAGRGWVVAPAVAQGVALARACLWVTGLPVVVPQCRDRRALPLCGVLCWTHLLGPACRWWSVGAGVPRCVRMYALCAP